MPSRPEPSRPEPSSPSADQTADHQTAAHTSAASPAASSGQAASPQVAASEQADLSPNTAALSVVDDGMNFHTRKWVKPEDLNANGTLFGGSLLRWIDEEAAIYAILQMGNHRAVTKLISEINFVSSAVQGDLIEMGLKATKFGRTSLTMRAEVRNMLTRQLILSIDKIVFVSVDEHGVPQPHGYTDITYQRDRMPVRPQGMEWDIR